MFKRIVVALLATVAVGSCGPVDEPLAPVAVDMTEPVRIETTAATFIVRESVAPDFQRLLAGQPTDHQYYAGVDVP